MKIAIVESLVLLLSCPFFLKSLCFIFLLPFRDILIKQDESEGRGFLRTSVIQCDHEAPRSWIETGRLTLNWFHSAGRRRPPFRMEFWFDQWESSRNNLDLLGLFCWESHEKMHALSYLYADYGAKAQGPSCYTCIIGLFGFVVCCRKLPGPAGGRVPVSSQRHAERLCEVPGDDWNHSGHEPGLPSTYTHVHHICTSPIPTCSFTRVSFLCMPCVTFRSTTTSSWWSRRSIRCWVSWGRRWTIWKRACRPCWTVQPES